MDDNAMAVSILTPTRNRGGSFLPLAIASVRAMRLSRPYEHVIVDDGSDDGSADYLSAEAAADLLTVSGVEQRYRYLEDYPEYWAVHANALRIDETGRYLIGADVTNYFCPDRARCADLFYRSAIIPNASTALYRRDALRALGGWDESLSCCEDYDLWLRSVDRYGPPGFLDTIVALYRTKEHGLGIDSVRSGAHARNQRLVQARFAHLVTTP